MVSFDTNSDRPAAAFFALHVAPPGVRNAANNTPVQQNCKNPSSKIR
jgi:hypothetical protein